MKRSLRNKGGGGTTVFMMILVKGNTLSQIRNVPESPTPRFLTKGTVLCNQQAPRRVLHLQELRKLDLFVDGNRAGKVPDLLVRNHVPLTHLTTEQRHTGYQIHAFETRVRSTFSGSRIDCMSWEKCTGTF